MKLSKRTKCLLICMLILLAIVMRLPSYPHERGSPDEFTFHALANSVSEFGYAKWWMNPWCVFGLYPYAFVSATAFLFSGVSQCTGMSMESCTWLLCTLLGIFIVFSAYIMAGKIRDDDMFIFLVAFFIALSPGVLNYTTWQVSARGTFLAFLPLFIYLILKTHDFAVRGSVLILVLLVFLLSTHHFVYFTIPIILGFVVSIIVYKLRTTSFISKIKYPEIFPSMLLATLLVAAFLMPFFTRVLITGSRYEEVIYLIERSVRYVGFVLPLAIGGITFLIFKHKKEFGELFLLLCLALFVPLMYEEVYYPFFGAVILCTFLGIGVANICEMGITKKRMRVVMVILVIIFIGFSAFYQHGRTNIKGHQAAQSQFYLEDTIYNSGMWIKNYIPGARMVMSSGFFHIPAKILAISEVPLLSMPCPDLVNGFVDVNEDIKVVKTSPLSEAFYRDNPYVLSPEVHNPWLYRFSLQKLDIGSSHGKSLINKKNITHVIECEYLGSNIFTRSIHAGRYDAIFSNGKIHVWCINGS